MAVRIFEILGILIVLTIVLLGVGGLWRRLFPKALPESDQRPDQEDHCCAKEHCKPTDADRES